MTDPNQNQYQSPQNSQHPPQGQQPQVVYVEKKKNGGCIKWGAIILGALIVLGILSSLIGGGEDSESATNSVEPAGSEAIEKDSQDAEKDSAKDSSDSLAIGETYSTKKGLDIVINAFNPETDVLGQQLSCAAVTYTNNGEKQVDFQGYWDWKVQNPAGVITDPTFSGNDNLESGSLAPGGTVSGNVCFDGSEPGEYLINYSPTLSLSSDKASWKATL